MNKKLKVFSLMFAGFLSISLLSGCGTKNNNSSDTSDDEIIVWSYMMDNEVEAVDKIAQKWAEENNKKVKVIKDNSDFQNFLQAANSSKGPYIIF